MTVRTAPSPASQAHRQGQRLETRTEVRAPAGGAPLVVDHAPRCWNCDHPLAWHATRPWSIRCSWCRKTTSSPEGGDPLP